MTVSLTEQMSWTLNWQRHHLLPHLQCGGAPKRIRAYWEQYRRFDAVMKFADLDGTSEVVDVGAGLASITRCVEGRRRALDPLATHWSALLPYPPGVEPIDSYGEHIPLPDNSMDLAICTNCIDHTERPADVMSEMGRVVRAGGLLWLTCEVRELTSDERNPGHPHSLDRASLLKLIEGWEVVLHWESPWVGLYRFFCGEHSSSKTEAGWLLRQPV